MTRVSGLAFSASTLVIGPVPAPSSTRTLALAQSTFRTVARESQGLLGARLAILVPWRRNFVKKRRGGVTAGPPRWPGHALSSPASPDSERGRAEAGLS